MRPDSQGGPGGSDELADEVWDDESPAATPGEPSEAAAGNATPGHS